MSVHEVDDGHCEASGSEACLVMFSLYHCTTCSYPGCSLALMVSLPRP